jgi:hypothetical protein
MRQLTLKTAGEVYVMIGHGVFFLINGFRPKSRRIHHDDFGCLVSLMLMGATDTLFCAAKSRLQ